MSSSNAKKVVQTYVSFGSQDRNREAWNDTNNYQIDIPKFKYVSAIKLSSFEMPQISQYTTESSVDDTLHVHEGCIIGCANDTSIMLDQGSLFSSLHENQVMVSYCSLIDEYVARSNRKQISVRVGKFETVCCRLKSSTSTL